MQDSIDIPWLSVALFSLTLLIPLAINRFYSLSLGRSIAMSVVRMTVQLLFIGLYLEYLFSLNNLWLNIAWLLVMVLIGASAILDKSNLSKQLMFSVSSGLLVGLLPVLLVLCVLVVQPTPFYSAQYVIPLAGMLLGNSLSGNIIALQNLFDAFESRKSEYEASISLGTTGQYAARPFVQQALQKAMAPILATMTTTGLVSLPGMMTGQILGGISPLVAIKYQLMIMIAIFVVMSTSVVITLQLTLGRAIAPTGQVTISPTK